MRHAAKLRLGALLAAWIAYFALALDGRLYWHDVRYLYATATYSLSELFAGVWDPQYGEALDPAASGGFYLVKFSLLAALEGLFAVWPADQGGFAFAGTVSLLAVGAGALLARPVLERAMGLARGSDAVAREPDDVASNLATGAVCLLLVSPAVVWLGGKVLGESLAFGLTLASCLCLLRRRNGSPAQVASVVGLGALALHVVAVGARPNFGLIAPALCLSLASVACASDRRTWLRWAGLLVAAQGLTHVALFACFGGAESFFGYLGAYVAGSRPLLISALGGLAALGMLAPLALAAAWSTRSSVRTLLVRWTALTLGPALAFAALYQVEARYLLPGFVPLAGLAALGAEAIWSGVVAHTRSPSARRWAGVVFSAAAAMVLAANVMAGSILPDEIDTRALRRIVHHPVLEGGARPLLIPWAYSDFHYLVATHPQHDLRFVHVPRTGGELQAYSPEWQARLAEWYGEERLLLDRAELDRLLDAGPVHMLWWGVHPPLERMARRLEALGLPGPGEAVRGLGGDAHGDQTWLVEERDLVRVPVAEAGIYRLERIEARRE